MSCDTLVYLGISQDISVYFYGNALYSFKIKGSLLLLIDIPEFAKHVKLQSFGFILSLILQLLDFKRVINIWYTICACVVRWGLTVILKTVKKEKERERERKEGGERERKEGGERKKGKGERKEGGEREKGGRRERERHIKFKTFTKESLPTMALQFSTHPPIRTQLHHMFVFIQ